MKAGISGWSISSGISCGVLMEDFLKNLLELVGPNSNELVKIALLVVIVLIAIIVFFLAYAHLYPSSYKAETTGSSTLALELDDLNDNITKTFQEFPDLPRSQIEALGEDEFFRREFAQSERMMEALSVHWLPWLQLRERIEKTGEIEIPENLKSDYVPVNHFGWQNVQTFLVKASVALK